ncbi:MAG: tRNA 4-thiouridine(8) synthase ThiI, partial [Thermoprotei archaeon]
KMNVEELVNEAVKNRRVVSILEAKTPSLKELIIGNIPQDSVVIDLRSPEEYSEWHYPNAINVPFQDLLGFTSKLSRDKIYVLYCDEGSLSIEAAFLLNKMGYKAYSLHGGTRKLRRICQLRFS